jgi:hypothetical protein
MAGPEGIAARFGVSHGTLRNRAFDGLELFVLALMAKARFRRSGG